MAKLLCPTCFHRFQIELTSADSVVACPKCSLKLQATAHLETASSADSRTPSSQPTHLFAIGLFVLTAMGISIFVYAQFRNSNRSGEDLEINSSFGLAELGNSNARETHQGLTQQQSDYLERRGKELEEKMKSIDPSDTEAIEMLRAEVEDLEATAREFVSDLNRPEGTQGYSLETRMEAARRTLVQQGYSDSEARLMVENMVKYGTLPDPPRR